MKPTRLLNDDGTASMATIIMLSHHAFRRDLGRFARALASFDPSRTAALGEEWATFRASLHGHHMMEDQHIFPGMQAQHAELASVVAELSAQHAQIDPLLERGDRAFAALPAEAAAVIAELIAHLDAHLDREEATIIPLLRDAREFPAPPTDADAEMYAAGFAWSTHGIAPEVLAQVEAMLPAALTLRLPAARKVFDARCERVWGSAACGSSTTSIPERV